MQIVLLMILALYFSPLQAQPMSGDELYDYFGEYLRVQNNAEGNLIKAGMFLGYVRGILDALDGTALCLPENVPMEYVIRRITESFQNRSFAQRGAARSLILDSLRDQFSCRK